MALHIQSEIILLSKERYEFLNKYEESYDEDLMKYNITEPIEIDELSEKIYNMIAEYQEQLPLEFIIEELTKLGQAPNILYDDNGHFSITSEGVQSLSQNYNKVDDRDDTNLSFSIKKDDWFNTIREALKSYLEE